MTEKQPNKEQEEFIKTIEGPVLVDAGAGTGKTFAITQRYTHLLEQGNEPHDILLLTFTQNAADNMRKRIISSSDQSLHNAPISTFHAYCRQLVDNHTTTVADTLGLDENMSSELSILSNKIQEQQAFKQFYNKFQNTHPEHENFYRLISDENNLLNLIKTLASRGIIPTNEGWYRNSKKYLRGDKKEFLQRLQEINAPGNGSRGPTHSQLSKKAYQKMRNLVVPDDAPNRSALRDGKQIDPQKAQEAFEEQKEQGLFSFIHDLYLGYVEYSLQKNYINFPFLLIFTYVLLCNDEELRQDLSFDHVMIDEFQDTNEIQLKISMLLSSNGNIAAVGDWKQSIYSFQYTDIDNILNFQKRLKQFKNDLNTDRERLNYSITPITEITFTENFRSTQQILDTAEQALLLPGRKNTSRDHALDQENIQQRLESLESTNTGPGKIGKILADDEASTILAKLQELVDNEEHLVPADDDRSNRPITWDDIAILTRTQDFALSLQRKARRHNIPLAYEGGVRLFQTDPGIMLLAWLRVLNWKHSTKGWSVILEEAGYTIDDIEHILNHKTYPDDMLAFRSTLLSHDSIPTRARLVFEKYGMNNGFGEKIVDILYSTLQNSYMDLGKLISFIEANIEEGTTYEVDTSTEESMATVQTIHAAKGLEYPVVFVADVNNHRFPSRNRSEGRIRYNDPIGLRQTKEHRDYPPYIFDNWRQVILNPSKDHSGYNEERRLFYVAMTRAENYLYVTAQEGKSSPFFDIDMNETTVDNSLEKQKPTEKSGKTFQTPQSDRKAPIKLSAHALMDTLDKTTGKGPEFGRNVHRFAEQVIKGRQAEPTTDDENHVKAVIDGLSGTVRSEVSILLPIKTDQRRYTVSGTIDILHSNDDTIDIIDLKTDRERTNRDEYRKQLSAYFHAVKEANPQKDITASILWTEKKEKDRIEPFSKDEIARMI